MRVVTYKSQRYLLIVQSPYRRKDGKRTVISTWEAKCPVCGKAFQFTSPGLEFPRYPNRRCKKHRDPGVAVVERRRMPKPRVKASERQATPRVRHAAIDG